MAGPASWWFCCCADGRRRHRRAVFLLLLMAQNGAALDFDKLVMLVFAIQLARRVRTDAGLRAFARPGLRA